MTEPTGPEPERPDRPPSLLWRVVRSAIAPDVLEDGGHDAPLSRRGQLLFRGIVAILVVGIVVVLAITLAQK